MKILKKTYNKKSLDDYKIVNYLGVILSLIIFIALFRVDLNFANTNVFQIIEQEIIQMEEVIQTEQQQKPPPPPRPPVPVEVPNDQILDDLDLNLDVSLDLDMMLDIPPPPPTRKQVVEDEEPEIFIVVENEPILIGGLEGIQKNIKYPELARRAGIEGRVFIQFIVDERGNVIDPVVIRGIGGGCDEAALEAVKKAKFTPGKQRGKPVKVQYSLPITFRLGG
jgi:protein TonB